MKFHLINLGCKVNRVESDTLAAACLAQGGTAVPVDAADVIFINTCTVTGEAEKKTRKAVRRALRENTQARIVVTGCAAAIAPEVFGAMDPRVCVQPDKSKVLQACGALPASFPQAAAAAAHSNPTSAPASNPAAPALRVGTAFPTRVGIKVQDGCNNACTYCIVHVARGRSTSRPFAEVVAEVQAYAAAGTKEIVLTGINLGSYASGGYTLVDLLKALLDASEAAAVRFRLSSIEPRDVNEALIALLAHSDGRLCRHLHLPLQAGSTKVLREMARPYTAAAYEQLVDALYAAMPTLSLSTDIIVGFPGETEADFAETLAVARRCRFSKIHVFPYSPRATTPAAARSDQVAPHIKADRTARLHQVAEALRAQAYSQRVGTTEQVLIEQNGHGTTESYFEIPVPPQAIVGSLAPLSLPPASSHSLSSGFGEGRFQGKTP
ncbi:MAG: tRNA (N(6)-L-threonylcarbamoyladenosine(37)-C(2))-methylthiotransferase MtaB [Raoultibacter sp.]